MWWYIGIIFVFEYIYLWGMWLFCPAKVFQVYSYSKLQKLSYKGNLSMLQIFPYRHFECAFFCCFVWQNFYWWWSPNFEIRGMGIISKFEIHNVKEWKKEEDFLNAKPSSVNLGTSHKKLVRVEARSIIISKWHLGFKFCMIKRFNITWDITFVLSLFKHRDCNCFVNCNAKVHNLKLGFKKSREIQNIWKYSRWNRSSSQFQWPNYYFWVSMAVSHSSQKYGVMPIMFVCISCRIVQKSVYSFI